MKKYVLVIAIALAVAGGFLALLKPEPPAGRAPPRQAADAPLAIPAQRGSGPDPNIGVSVPNSQRNDIEIAVQDGRRVSGPELVLARQGEIVTFRITSDVSDDFVLRGYETQVQLFKGSAATLILKANRAGRFPYELQKSGVRLGVLEVTTP
jgi:hypothetical protein